MTPCWGSIKWLEQFTELRKMITKTKFYNKSVVHFSKINFKSSSNSLIFRDMEFLFCLKPFWQFKKGTLELLFIYYVHLYQSFILNIF